MFKKHSPINLQNFPTICILITTVTLNLLLVLFHLKSPFILKGDSIEYIIQTQAIVFDKTLTIDTEKRAEYWNKTNPYNLKLAQAKLPIFKIDESNQAGAGFGSLYAGKDLKYRYVHSWYYSIFVAPIYFIFTNVGKIINSNSLEYFSFRIVNLFFLFLPFVFSYYCFKKVKERLGFIIIPIFFLMTYSSLGYLSWEHTELFQFGLLASGIILYPKNSRLNFFSPLFIGIASGQNLPSFLFLFVKFIFELHEEFLLSAKFRTIDKSRTFLFILKYGLAFIIAIIPHIYIYLSFDVLSVIEKLNFANLKYASIDKLQDFFLSPLIGCFWYYPIVFIVYFFVNDCKNINYWIKTVLLFVFVLIVAYITTSTTNLRSAQEGAIRYSAWVLAPLVGFILERVSSIVLSQQRNIFLALFSTIICIVVLFQTIFPRYSSLNFVANKIYKYFHYQEDPETFGELVSKTDFYLPFQFNSCYQYVYSDRKSSQTSVMTLITKRFFNQNCSNTQEIPLCNRIEINWKTHPYLGDYSYFWDINLVDKCYQRNSDFLNVLN